MKQVKTTQSKQLIGLARKAVITIVGDGLKMSLREDTILIAWPRERKGKYYLGGAHGLSGVLHMLL